MERGGDELMEDVDVQQDRGYLKQSQELVEMEVHVIIFGSLVGGQAELKMDGGFLDIVHALSSIASSQ